MVIGSTTGGTNGYWIMLLTTEILMERVLLWFILHILLNLVMDFGLWTLMFFEEISGTTDFGLQLRRDLPMIAGPRVSFVSTVTTASG